MRLITRAVVGLLFAVLLGIAGTAISGHRHGCSHCGCTDKCQKVCRLVCEEKKVEIVCYGCACEDFCVPDHSKPGCLHCDTVCDDCAEAHKAGKTLDPKAPHAEPKSFVWRSWIPTNCAKIYTKKKLMKKIVTKKIPSYKWVVEDLCDKCEVEAVEIPAEIEPGARIPPPPKTDAKIIPGKPVAAVTAED